MSRSDNQFQEINLAIVDDHRAVRQALSKIISSYDNLNVVFEAEDGLSLIKSLTCNKVDVVLLDIKMKGMNGIEALKIIKSKHSDVRVLMLSAFFDEIYVAQCLEYGINGFLTKSMEISEIIQAIKTAFLNEVYFTNLLSVPLFRRYICDLNKSNSIFLPEFTKEEIKIIECLRHEMTTEEISKEMFLSKRSIEIKREKLKEKANVKTIGGLLLYCCKRGLID